MHNRFKFISLAVIVMLLASTACLSTPQPTPTPTATPAGIPTDSPQVAETPEQAADIESGPPTEGPTPTPRGPFGPTGFPTDINPLTGLPVDNPDDLNRRPMLVKISNESPDVRPQSGLGDADHVWEYQMEGWALTRYTAIFYGQTPEYVGSVRSARLIDVEHLVNMYGGILVNSGASTNRSAGGPPRINEQLRAASFFGRVISEDFGYGDPYLVRLDGIPRANIAYHHTLFANPTEIWRLADEKTFNDRPNLDGMLFDWNVPANGTPTTELSIDYAGRGPKRIFRYDQATNKWLIFIEDQNRAAAEAQEFDHLTEEPLAFDNVVLIWAFHFDADYIEDEAAQLPGLHVDLSGEGDAVLLRDGIRFEIKWRRAATNGILQFFDTAGNPIAFKPGQTWFNTASNNAAVPEVVFLP